MHVLIVDDHPLLIKGVEALLVELESSVTTAGARDIDEAIECVRAHPPQLILLDLNLPGMKDLDALAQMRQMFPEITIVVVSANDSPDHIWRAIELGAAGYIPKDTDQQLMIQALRIVLARGIYLPPHAVRAGTDAVAGPLRNAAKPALSARQVSVLRGILQGKSNKVIARELDIAEGTVKAHLSSVYLALGVSSRLQAMARAHELSLVDEFAAVC